MLTMEGMQENGDKEKSVVGHNAFAIIRDNDNHPATTHIINRIKGM